MTAPSTNRLFGPGFYGKLPSRGDFVTFGLTGAFLDCWDDWLGDGLEGMRASVGRRWESLLDTSPAWRFVLPAGLTGPHPTVGVMIPSRDKVARRFPFVIACHIGAGWDDVRAMPAACRDWFDMAEMAAFRLVALAAEPVFARKVVDALGLPPALTPDRLTAGAAAVEAIIGTVPDGFSLWWTRGGGGVAASMMAAPEMPSGALFGALLDGDWSGHGWDDMALPERTGIESLSDGRGFPPLGGFSGLMPLSA